MISLLRNNKKKFIVGCLLLVLGFFFSRLFFYQDLGLDDITINGNPINFDRVIHMGLYSLSEEEFEKDSLLLHLNTGKNHSVLIDDCLVNDTTICVKPPYNRVQIPIAIKHSLWGASSFYYTTLSLTCLPILNLKYDELGDTEYAPGCVIKVYEGQNKAQTLNAKIRYRGNTSKIRRLAKISLGIKLCDESGESKAESVLGLRNSSNWFLDPLQTDRTRMHNLVNYEIWEEFSNPPYHKQKAKKAHNAAHGRFVELFTQGRYRGIFCLMEKIDRDQLKLKKTDPDGTVHGILYKNKGLEPKGQAIEDLSFFIGSGKLNLEKSNWGVKYPNTIDKNLYEPLEEVINFLTDSSPEDFANHVDEYLDVPVWMDLYIFVRLIWARDNLRSNKFVYFYDVQKSKKLGVVLWDMDCTWDNNPLDASGMNAAQIELYNKFLKKVKIFERFEKDYPGFREIIESRWASLRETYFTYEHIKSHFDKYFFLFEKSGAYTREERIWTKPTAIEEREINIPWLKISRKSKKWSLIFGEKLDFEYEEEYLNTTIKKRLKILDQEFNYNLIEEER